MAAAPPRGHPARDLHRTRYNQETTLLQEPSLEAQKNSLTVPLLPTRNILLL